MTEENWDDTSTDVLVNGVDALTGSYAAPLLSARLLCKIAEGCPLSPEELDELRGKQHHALAHLGVAAHIDPNDLGQAGWGIVFAQDDPDVVPSLKALAPLLRRRKAEAGQYYREFTALDGIQPMESGRAFLNRHGSTPGPVDPKRGVPYYLLVVGPPTRASFDAQTDFAIRHAVGRLDLGGIDALAAYAEQTVRREEAAKPMAKRAAVYAPRNPGDVSTQRSARFLAPPLANGFAEKFPAWTVDRRIAGDATKEALRALLHNASPPSILFTASHGARVHKKLDGTDKERDAQSAMQEALQGALVTQEWPGPMGVERPLSDSERFAADDVTGTALGGMIAFLFACYSAGTPLNDEFLPPELGTERAIASAPFVARLPQRMLMQGAAAVIGHVERAWTWSFRWPRAGAAITVFESVLHALARGDRVGAAFDYLGRRYGDVSIELTEELRLRRAQFKNDEVVAGLWTAQTDARNFVVLGDPAVRLTIAADS